MMRRTIQAALCLFVSPLLVAQQKTVQEAVASPDQNLPAGFRVVRIPRDYPVSLRLVHELSSATAHVGDPVDFELEDAIFVEGREVLPAGSRFTARVKYASPKTGDKFGTVGFSIPELDLGHHARIQLDTETSQERKDGRAEGTAWFAALLLLALPFAVVSAVSRPEPDRPQEKLETQETVYPAGFAFRYYTRKAIGLPADQISQPASQTP